MGLEEMLSTIRADTEVEYAKTISDAKAAAEKILAEARQTSQSTVEQKRIQSEKELQEEKLRSIASARLEVKRRLLETRDEVLKKDQEEAMRYLKEFAKSTVQQRFSFKDGEGWSCKNGASSVVEVNAADKKLLGTTKSSEYLISALPIDCIGGAIISSKDGKRRVDNTIESIFGERKEDLRLKLSEQVFGKQG